MSAQRLTVLIAARNEATRIGPAIESVLTQAVPGVAILVVDDHSDDGTAEVAASFDGVEVVPCEGAGVVDANNTALRHARTDLVFHLDADDRLLPGSLLRHLDARAADDVVLVAGGEHVVDDDGVLIQVRPVQPTGRHMGVVAFIRTPAAHSALSFRRGPIVELGGYRRIGGLEAAADADLMIRVFRTGATCIGLDTPSVARTIRSGSVTSLRRPEQRERAVLTTREYRDACFDQLAGFRRLLCLGRELRARSAAGDLIVAWQFSLVRLALQRVGERHPIDGAQVVAAAVGAGPIRFVRSVLRGARGAASLRTVRQSVRGAAC